MDRAGVGTARGLLCPECATELEGARGGAGAATVARCSRCGVLVRLDDCGGRPGHEAMGLAHRSPPLSSLRLAWHNWMLRIFERLYWLVTFAGTIVCLTAGGIIPVIHGWLSNQIDNWSDLVAALGGVWFRVESQNPDSDLGPVLARVDAPQLFTTIEAVGRRLGVKPPGQVRLTYLPCCGVVAWGRSRALIIGLPLFRVLTQGELRAIVAHELAHLARGDATRAARSARFVEALEQAVERNGPRVRGPLGAWARYCLRETSRLIEPVARSQEARADRFAAAIAGGSAASSALVKVAIIQPLFRELLEAYDPNDAGALNLYAFFRAFWYRLPSEVHTAMRLSVLTRRHDTFDPAHPPLPDRIAALQSYSDPVNLNGDGYPATTFLGDPEIFEQMLHNRLFGLPPVEPSIFHKAGT
ncbi:MAG TPA: M48 family metallopeptidase [Isosphaeraceae bacterium]|nr:M48 family metallopeptidase [Isosphaeraceae bacterium]